MAPMAPMYYGNIPGSNRKRRPKRTPGDRYRILAYSRAVARACERAHPIPEGLTGEPLRQWKRQFRWHPHQLRHNAATRLRKQFGLDIAQVILGHKTLEVTQVYAEKDVASAQRVMSEIGLATKETLGARSITH